MCDEWAELELIQQELDIERKQIEDDIAGQENEHWLGD